MSADTPVLPKDTYCGHFQQLEKARFNRLFSRVAAIRAAGDDAADAGYPDIFEYTHHPITVFKQSAEDHTAEQTPVHEHEILDEFDPSAQKNFSVVIEGPVGTGKSELCAYLTHKLRNERDRPVLRVDKDSDLLTMLTETIPEFYERELGEPLDTSGDLRDLAEGLESNPEIVAGLVLNKGLDMLRKEYDINPTKEMRDDLEEFLLDRLNELVERRHQGLNQEEDEREGFRFVREQDYKSGHTDALHVFEGTRFDAEPWELLNDKFWSALLDEFDSPPLNDLLEDVGQAFDTRPVCVFEDFSIAAVQAEKLRNYMERDNKSDNWDFIVAGTTDYTRALRTRTSEDRFRFYQTNQPESKQVDFLDESSVVDFIRPYLAYPKTSDDSLRYDPSTDGDGTLQAPPENSICGKCQLCADSFRDLFPFNETFIERIYNPGLEEDDRRPRSIIIIIKDILEEVYYGPTGVPSNAQVLSEEVNSPDVLVTDEVLEESETLANLAHWYGKQISSDGDTYYKVDRAFTTAFAVDEIPDPETTAEGTAVADVIFDEEAVYIPAAGDVSPEPPEPVDPPDDPPVDPPEPTEGPVDRKYSSLRGQVADWANNPTSEDYADTRKYMERAIKSLLKYLTDDFSLWSGTGLGFYIGKKRPFVYDNSSTAPEPHQIILDLDTFRASTHRTLLRYGIELEEGSDPRSVEQFLDEEGHGTHFTRLAEEWQSKLVGEYVTNDEVLYRKAAQKRGYQFDDFVVATYAWMVMLDDPWQEITAETLNERFQESTDFTIDSQLEKGLAPLPNDTRACFTEAIEIAPYIEEILGSRLGVTRNALDVPAVRDRLARHSPYDVIDNLAKSPYIDNINRNVRFSSNDKTKLHEMALRMYNLKRKVDDDVVDMPRAANESQILAQLDGVSMEEVKEIHQTLTQSYADQMPSGLKEALDGFVSRIDQETVDSVIAGGRLIQTLENGNHAQVQRSFAELKLQEHPITEYLDTLSDGETSVTSDGFAPTFQEVSRYYE